jgi:hypothetical protein
MTQINLGGALMELGRRESGTTRLEEAVIAYRAAIEELSSERWLEALLKTTQERLIEAENFLLEWRGQARPQ